MEEMQRDLNDTLSEMNGSHATAFERRIADGLMRDDRVMERVDDILSREVPEPPILFQESASIADASHPVQSANERDHEPAFVSVNEFSEFKQ
jgi:hypothetical protein